MARHPIESNFYARASDCKIEVTFAPTRSVYTFSRLTTERGNPTSSDPLVHHAAKKGDTGDYEPAKVQVMHIVSHWPP
jgi:hypothetical protein